MWKIAVGVIFFACLISAVFIGHAIITGVAVPFPDPTPEQAAYERYHHAISQPLFLATVLSWFMAAVMTAIGIINWLVRRRRTE